MKGLKTVLWIAAVVILVGSLVALVLPFSTLQSLGRNFGAEVLPADSVAFRYTIRAMMVVSFVAGIYYLILARNPLRYGVLIPFTGIANIAVGLACLCIGIGLDAPVIWYMGDFVCLGLLGALILFFWNQARGSEERAAAAGEAGPAPQAAEQ